MKKTSISLLTFSLLLIIPATISTERKSAKAMVANYLNNGGEMIMHAEDGNKELNLLKHFQGLSRLYQGEISNEDIKKFSNISYCKWLTLLPSDYTELVKHFFTYKYRTFKDAMVSNTFHLPQELLCMLKKHVSFQGIRELYRLQANKKRQNNYSLGYSLIFLLKGFALFNLYQAGLIKNIMQHWLLIVMTISEFVYIDLFPVFAFPDFLNIGSIRVFLNVSNLMLMYYNVTHRMSFVAFLQGMISTINLAMISYQRKRCYDACDEKINTMTIQGLKPTEIVDELQETVQLLKNHQDTVLACYQGEPFNKIPGVNSATTEVENVGSIIAQHIDPSIKPDQITRNPSTCESKHSDFRHNFCRSMNIIVPSCVYAAFAGIVLQQYFSA